MTGEIRGAEYDKSFELLKNDTANAKLLISYLQGGKGIDLSKIGYGSVKNFAQAKAALNTLIERINKGIDPKGFISTAWATRSSVHREDFQAFTETFYSLNNDIQKLSTKSNIFQKITITPFLAREHNKIVLRDQIGEKGMRGLHVEGDQSVVGVANDLKKSFKNGDWELVEVGVQSNSFVILRKRDENTVERFLVDVTDKGYKIYKQTETGKETKTIEKFGSC